MDKKIRLSDIICNAFDKDYSLEQAAIDLGELVNKRALINRRYGPGHPRLAEVEKMILIQEKLALVNCNV